MAVKEEPIEYQELTDRIVATSEYATYKDALKWQQSYLQSSTGSFMRQDTYNDTNQRNALAVTRALHELMLRSFEIVGEENNELAKCIVRGLRDEIRRDMGNNILG